MDLRMDTGKLFTAVSPILSVVMPPQSSNKKEQFQDKTLPPILGLFVFVLLLMVMLVVLYAGFSLLTCFKYRAVSFLEYLTAIVFPFFYGLYRMFVNGCQPVA